MGAYTDMNAQKEKFYDQLDNIKKLIDDNENSDGTFRFDITRLEIALEFAKAEIEKTIK